MNLRNQIFTDVILKWFDQFGRKQLPWQTPRSAYRVWLSEIMLQQTQVATVIPYFNRFIAKFPDIQSLASAHEDEVLSLWAGLGYYRRARHLHETAKIIHHQFHNEFPQDIKALQTLPGIGASTAAAIASLAFQQATPILDGNVKRVLCRYFGVDGAIDQPRTLKILWTLADECMSRTRPTDYTQAIMDMGALCCTNKNPRCDSCPLKQNCVAHLTQRTHELPQKNKKIKIHEQTWQVLLIHNQTNQIYLEQRPAHGIWGKLWCLPCLDQATPIHAVLHQSHSAQNIFTITHALTHMRLTLEVSQHQVLSSQDIVPKSPSTPVHWLSQHEIEQHGMPKPIKDIINQFYQGLF